MSRIVAFKADDEEADEIMCYLRSRHLKSLPEFARMAVFAYMRQNRPGSHRTGLNAEKGNGSGRAAPALVL